MPDDHAAIFDHYLSAYAETGNALFMADAFRYAMRVGCAPPHAVLQWVNQALQAWEDSEGSADVGQLLGLKPRRGKRPVFEDFERRTRDAVLMLDMDCLVHLGCTREEAALIASDRNPAHWKAACPTVDTLLSMYARRKDAPSAEHVAGLLATPESTSEFLARFGRHYLTARLKSML